MRRCCSCCKRFIFYFIFACLIVNMFFPNTMHIAFAASNESEEEINLQIKTDEILNSLDTDDLDEFIDNDFNFFNGLTFKQVVKKVLSGSYFDEYDSLYDFIKTFLSSNLKTLFQIIILILIVLVLNEMFNSIASSKHDDLNKTVKIIISLVLAVLSVSMVKNLAENISNSLNNIFNFVKILFPIILSLVLLSGANGTYSIYNSISVFLLNTGMYLFVYVLLPLAVSISVLSAAGSVFQSKRFSRINDIFKSIFKYIIVGFIGIFGLLSSVSLVTSGVSDGISLRLTRFAIKNYVPVLGGYISDGFNFVHSCSIMIKNAVGLCGIIVLFFIVLKPILNDVVLVLGFKLISLGAAFIGSNEHSDMFKSISKGLSYFVTILVGVFLIFFIFIYLLIISVSVVSWFIVCC